MKVPIGETENEDDNGETSQQTSPGDGDFVKISPTHESEAEVADPANDKVIQEN